MANTNINMEELAKQVDLNEEIDYITSINNNIDYLTVSARDAGTVLTIKNALTKLANSLNVKNTGITAIRQYFNDRNSETAISNTPKVNGPRS